MCKLDAYVSLGGPLGTDDRDSPMCRVYTNIKSLHVNTFLHHLGVLSTKALDMMSYADKTYREAQAQVIAERNLANARVHEERVHHSRASTRVNVSGIHLRGTPCLKRT